MAVLAREVSNEAWAALAQKVQTSVLAGQRTLPVAGELQRLFPEGGIRRGSTVSVLGSTSLALEVIAAATKAGSWCAAVGFGQLNCLTASEVGVQLPRFPLIDEPGVKWTTVVAALLDGFDMVLVRSSASIRENDVRRLAARARQREAVLVVVGSWPHADIRLRVERSRWAGLGNGHGYFAERQLEVMVEGRGVASRSKSATLTAMPHAS